jgi:hypothetical protein
MASISRRGLLRDSALLSLAATFGFSGAFGIKAARAADGDEPQTILDVAATAETFACTHYYRALKSTIKFTSQQTAYLKAALEEELIHLEFLNANGGKALATTFFFPQGTFNSAVSFATVSSVAETVFVGAYLAASRRFAELGAPLLAATAAQIAVVEGQHLALVRQTGNELPNNIAFGEPIFYNVSEAVPVVEPLLNGKEGGLGPMEPKSVDYPGAEAIRALIGKTLLTPVKTFAEMTPPASTGGSATAVATEAGSVATESAGSATAAPTEATAAPTEAATVAPTEAATAAATAAQ